MRLTTVAPIAVLLAVALVGSASAQNDDRGDNKGVEFSIGEQQIISAYFATHAYTPESLPPGIQKKLARGKPLPPGIAKRSLPSDLTATLPKREGFEITIFGDRIVLLEASGLVVDILSGIFD